VHWGERAIEDIDPAGPEVRRQQLRTGQAVDQGQTLVDRVAVPPAQADRSPSSPMKMNRDTVVVPGSRNAVVSLKTCPVGAPPGMLTTSGTAVTGLPFTSPV